MFNTASKPKVKWWKAISMLIVCLPVLVALRLHWFSSQGTILFGSQARAVFNQCSREEPSGIDGFWCPYPWNIRHLEAALPHFLDGKRNETGPLVLKDYYFQYSGFIRNRHYLIYVNAYPKDTFDITPFQTRVTAENICDGGSNFFGFEFEPATGHFNNLSFNGSLG